MNLIIIIALLIHVVSGVDYFITGTIRDFTGTGDFARSETPPQDTGGGLVQSTLQNGKPVRSTASANTISDFPAWYDDPTTSLTYMVPWTAQLSLKSGSVYEYDANPFYPIDGNGLGNEVGNHNPYFTLAVTTEFRMPISGVTDIQLTFGSTDDLWVFVNGQLALDHGGLHAYSTKTLRMLDFVSIGALVEMQIFYAHRTLGTAPRLHLEMVAPSKCTITTAGTRYADVYPFTATNTILTRKATLVTGPPTEIKLISSTDVDSGGSAWHSIPMPIQHGFKTEFKFRMTNKGASNKAEGMAFVMQSDSSIAGGLEGNNLFYNIEKSVAVEIDTSEDSWESNGNHISVNSRYDLLNSPDHSQASLGGGNLLATDLDDGNWHTLSITYEPAGGTGTFKIYLDAATTPAVTASISDTNILAFSNGLAYLGFTASSSSTNIADVSVKDWKVWLVDVSPSRSTIASMPTTTAASDFQTSQGSAVLQTNDACGSVFVQTAGTVTMDLLDAALSSIPSSTASTDHQDGTYTVYFFHTLANPYTLSVKLRNTDVSGSPFPLQIVPAPADPSKCTFLTGFATTLSAHANTNMEITINDRFNNQRADLNDVVTAQFSNTGSFESQLIGNKWYIIYFNDYAGTWDLFVRVAGQDIIGGTNVSPLSVTVVPGQFNGDIEISGAGLLGGVAGITGTFQIILYDAGKFNRIYSNAGVSVNAIYTVLKDTTDAAIPLEWNAVDELYDASYLANETGTYTITVDLLPPNPTTTSIGIVAGDLSTVDSSITIGTPSQEYGVAGVQHSIVVQCKDSEGNLRSQENPIGTVFTFHITDPTQTVLISCAPNQPANAFLGICTYIGGGRYELLYTPIKSASGASQNKVKVLDQLANMVGDSEPAYDVKAGALNAAHSSIGVSTPASPVAGQWSTFTIISRDVYDNIRAEPDDSSAFSISIFQTSAPQILADVTTLLNQNNGHYIVNWRGNITGTFEINAKVVGIPISDSPRTKAITSSTTYAASTILSGDGANGGIAETMVNVTIQARDVYGNLRLGTSDEASLFTLVVNPYGLGGSITTHVGATYTLGDGQYNTLYEVPPSGAPPIYNLLVTYNGEFGAKKNATVAVNTGVNYAICSGAGLTDATVGVVATFFIQDRNAGLQPHYEPQTSFVVTIKNGQHEVTGIVVNSSPTGLYTVTYTPTVTGEFSVVVSNGAVNTALSPYTLTIVAGSLSPSKTIVSGFPATVIAGPVFTFYITPRDAYGNDIKTGTHTFDLIYFPTTHASTTAALFTKLNDGRYEVNITMQKATNTLVPVDEMSIIVTTSSLIVGQPSYKLTVRPSTPHHSTSSSVYLYADNNPTAGTASEIRLDIRDIYDNLVDTQTNLITATLDANVNTTFSFLYIDGAAGRFTSSYTPTRSTETTRQLSIYVSNEHIIGSPFNLPIDPGDPDALMSSVTGMNVVFKAAKIMTFDIQLRDALGNTWKNDDDAIEINMVSGPTPTLLSNFFDEHPMQLLGNGKYRAKWESPQVASKLLSVSTSIPYVFSIQITYTSVLVPPQNNPVTNVFTSVNGLLPVTVEAGTTCASNTVIPPLTSSTIVAGTSTSLEIKLYDCATPPNLKINGGETVHVKFYNDGGTNQCPCPSTTCIDATNDFVYNTAIDNGDGTYTIQIQSNKAGKYSMRLSVDIDAVDTDVNTCNDYLRFTITPDAPSGANSIISYGETRAGIQGLMEITLQDQYNNRIEVGGQVVLVSAGHVAFPVGALCTNTSFFVSRAPWTDAQGVNQVQEILYSDHDDGLHSARYTFTKSAIYTVIASVNGEYIGTGCNYLTIFADTVHRFDDDHPTQITAAKKEEFYVTSYDQYNNIVGTVTDQEYTYITDFSNTALLGRSSPVGLIYNFPGGVEIAGQQHKISILSAWAGDYDSTLSLDADPIPTGTNSLSVVAWTTRVKPVSCADMYLNASYRCTNDECVSDYLYCDDSATNLCNGNDKLWLEVTYTNVSAISCGYMSSEPYRAFFRIASVTPKIGSNKQCNDGETCTWAPNDLTAPISDLRDYRNGLSVHIEAYVRKADVPYTDYDDDSNIHNFKSYQTTIAAHVNNTNNHEYEVCFDADAIETCTHLPKYCVRFRAKAVVDASNTISKCGVDSVCKDDCNVCPSDTIYCRDLGYCAESCPNPSDAFCPTDTPVRCDSGSTSEYFPLCRKSANDCPSTYVCPPGLVKCADGRSCALTNAKCFDYLSIVCPVGLVRCPDGQCMETRDSCSTPVTCSIVGHIRCPDGSCREHARECPNQYECEDASYIRCGDGSCRFSVSDCPTQTTCPIGYVKCENGACAHEIAQCPENIDGYECPSYLVRCFDGTCRPNRYMCPSGTTCSEEFPIRCSDGACVNNIGKCSEPTKCPAGTKRCPSGDCKSGDIADCPSQKSCNPSVPVLCTDGSCVTSRSACSGRSLPSCSASRPYRCIDGLCRHSALECESIPSCPSTKPIRCSDGRCSVSPEFCPSSLLDCQAPFVRCPNGACVHHISVCPTPVSCPVGAVRCPDGTCRTDCVEISRKTTPCGADQIACPQTNTGTTCRSSIKECPQGRTCPWDAPVLCIDNSCRRTLSDCPPLDEGLTSSLGCPSGTYAKGLSSCGVGTTCPADTPYKCHDESCRMIPEDCPPQPKCPLDTPYACADGSCDSSIDRCGGLVKCTDPAKPIKCPWFSSARGCVASIDDCPYIRGTQSNEVKYPCANYWNNRCRTGACTSDITLCKELQCPFHLSIRCPNGLCVDDASKCTIESNACPSHHPIRCQYNGLCMSSADACNSLVRACDEDGMNLCPDGTCQLNLDECNNATRCDYYSKACLDRTCVQVVDDEDGVTECVSDDGQSNICPPSRPYRCQDGYCAGSSALCPIVTTNATACATDRVVRCADGTCVRSSAQCPHLFPCEDIRCPDGSCRSDSSFCPPIDTRPLFGYLIYTGQVVGNCTNPKPFRCSNGMCAENKNMCIKDDTGCPSTWIKCQDTGQCAVKAASCTASAHMANGCPRTEPKRCINGDCKTSESTCNRKNGCPYTHPYRCGNGVCMDDLNTCTNHTLACPPTHIQCPDGGCVPSGQGSSCYTLNGCDGTNETRIRCANGECRKYNALTRHHVSGVADEDACPATVVCEGFNPVLCADGSCKPHGSFCRSLHPCPSTTPVLCDDLRTCATQKSQCPLSAANTYCPISSPVLCRDGACRKTISECTGTMFTHHGKSCEWPNGILCADGTCHSSTQSCATSMYTLRNNQECTNGYECYNGECTKSKDECEVFPLCPLEYPYLCQDGSCKTNAQACTASYSSAYENAHCTGGRTLCADGICRTSCPQTSGCKLQQYICESNVKTPGLSQCASSSCATATPSRTFSIPCETNCFRDITATLQMVSISTQEDMTITVSMDTSHIPRSLLMIPSGSLSQTTTFTKLKIIPIPTQQIRTISNPVHATRLPTYGTSLSFEETVLSSAFSCDSETDGALPLPLQYQAYYDVPTDIEDVDKFDYKDICLAYVDVSSNTWTCIEYEREVNNTIVSERETVWADDGRAKNFVHAKVPQCTSASGTPYIYAFILKPRAFPVAASTPTFWDRNKVAILSGIFGGLAFMIGMAYTASRLVRYRQKYDATQKEVQELEERHEYIDEFQGGLGVAGDDIVMVANPLVVQMNDLDDQLAQVQQQLGYQSSDARKLQQLARKKEELLAERDRLNQVLQEQQLQPQPQMPMEPLPTSFAISYADQRQDANTEGQAPYDFNYGNQSSSGRNQGFGPVKMKKKF